MKNQDNLLIDLINIFSFAIGIENLRINDEQIKELQEHLSKQDKQYERIINLLERSVEDGRREEN